MPKQAWAVQPYEFVGPLRAGATLGDLAEVLGEEPRRVANGRCQFRESGVLAFIDHDDRLRAVEFCRGSSIVPVFEGVKLLGNWTAARRKLLALGHVTPDPDRNEEQTFDIADGIAGWIRFDHVVPETISVNLG